MTRPQALRNFCLLDDMSFSEEEPMPKMAGTALEREAQYTYAYLIRRPMNSDRTHVHVTVVVYFRRPIESASEEAAFDGTNVEGNKITISYTAGNKPDLRQGSWILDGTMAAGATPIEPQGHFYRVEEVVDPSPAGVNTIDVFVNKPIRRLIADPTVVSDPTLRNIIVLDGVLDVFDKGVTDMLSPNKVN
jgi:hypothetical protein